MLILFTPYFFLDLMAGLIVLIPVLFSWRHIRTPGIRPLFYTMALMSFLLFTAAFEMAVTDLSVKKAMLVLEDLTYTVCVTAMFMFVNDYFLKANWLRPFLRGWLLVGAAILLLDLTNPWHGLAWTAYHLSTETNIMYATPGPGILLITLLTDLVGAVVLTVLGVYAARRSGWERQRAVYILIGMLAHFLTPIIMNSITNETVSVSVNPVNYAVTGLLVSWVVFEDQRHLLEEKSEALSHAQDHLSLKLAEQSKKMAGLFEILLLGNQEIRTGAIITSLLERISAVMDGAAVCLYAETDEGLQLFGSVGLTAQQSEAVQQFPRGWMPTAPEARIVPDLALDPAPPQAFLRAGWNSLLARWLPSDQETSNLLVAFWPHPRVFMVEELALFSAIADETRVILENVRIRTSAVEQALSQERRRISRDLHDTVTQSLNSIALTTEVAEIILAKGETSKLKRILASMHSDAQQALKELRLLLFQLHLESSANTDLVAALQHRITLVEKKAGLEVKLSLSGSRDWSPVVAQTLYYILSEALNNSIKHAFAKRVEILIERTPGRVVAQVRDDGRGFETGQTERGYGLGNMSERAARLGGQLDVVSSPGGGTLVTVRVPDQIQVISR